MAKHDLTFSPDSKFGSAKWVAITLGRSVDWFRKHRAELAASNFPQPDPVTGLWSKAAVYQWVERRSGGVHYEGPPHSPKVNLDVL